MRDTAMLETVMERQKMKPSSAMRMLAVACLGMIELSAIGCATTKAPTKGFRMPGGKAPAVRAATSSAMPGAPDHSPIPGYPAASPQAGVGSDPASSEIAQVGYCQSNDCGSSNPPSCDCSESTGSGACGGQECHPAGDCHIPYGYAMAPAGPVNAYGIDPNEFICDGGDKSPYAFVRRDDTIANLDAEDTIVHYTTEDGDIEVEESNRICMYAPRFASVRKVTGAVAGERAIGLKTFDRPVIVNEVEINEGGVMVTDLVELGHADVARRIDAMRDRNRGVPVESVLQLEQASDVLAALVGLTFDQLSEMRDDEKAMLEEFTTAAVAWTVDESIEVAIEDLHAPTLTRDETIEGFTIYEFPDAGRLQICKLADRADALPGDIVTFAIRVENVGDSAVNQVVLTDNLTTRLEYVPDSQTCSGGAEFETQINEGQSLKLLWKLTDKLRVGESVTIRFQCKMR